MIVEENIEQDEDTGKNRFPKAMYKLSLERGKDTTADRSITIKGVRQKPGRQPGNEPTYPLLMVYF